MTQYLTRIFKNGNSQAVRIPAELRLNTDKVEIYKNEQGDLVIHPVTITRGESILDAFAGFDDEFIQIMEDIIVESKRHTILDEPDREPL